MSADLILGLFPELATVGGIQQVSRHAGATLCEWAERTGRTCELAGLNDRRGENTFAVGDRRYPFLGFGRNKAAFALHVMRRAPSARLLLAGHVNLGPAGLLARMRQPELNFWVIAHGMEVWQPLRALRRAALRDATGVLAVSRNTAEAVEREQGVGRGKTNVLSPALDPGFLAGEAAPPTWPVPAGSRILLTVARLLASEPGKGVDIVIRALPRLLTAFPNLSYVVVGDGDARQSLEKLAAECGVAGKVIFTGAGAPGSLRGYYEAADVYVMPSRQEGFGIAYLEAMAAGKPAVGARCGGAPEVIADGQTGFLVSYGDAGELESRLAELFADDRLRQRMGETGRRWVSERHSFEQFRERLIAILETKRG